MVTVRELRDMCDKAISEGHGDKTIWISGDDEGNSFHCLYYGFDTRVDELDDFNDLDTNKDIILG